MKKRKKGYGALLALTVICTLAAVSTLIPSSSASKACLLGHKALCTFTPVSTVICLIVAASVCIVRKRKFTEQG